MLGTMSNCLIITLGCEVRRLTSKAQIPVQVMAMSYRVWRQGSHRLTILPSNGGRSTMTEVEITRALRQKHMATYRSKPANLRSLRKCKLRRRFEGRYAQEIASTEEKLQILRELDWEQTNDPLAV